jgi:hypothetical protein
MAATSRSATAYRRKDRDQGVLARSLQPRAIYCGQLDQAGRALLPVARARFELLFG